MWQPYFWSDDEVLTHQTGGCGITCLIYTTVKLNNGWQQPYLMLSEDVADDVQFN